MRRLMLVCVVVLAAIVPRGEASARRRAVRCCVMVPDEERGERPYCFILNVRPARFARKVCRAIDGTPHPVRDR
jgi:hypothetical protein